MSAPGYPPVPFYGYPGDQNQQRPNFDPFVQQYPDPAAAQYPVDGGGYQPQAPYQQPGPYPQPGPGYYQPPAFYSPQPEHYQEYAQPQVYAQPPVNAQSPAPQISPPLHISPTIATAPAPTTVDPSFLQQPAPRPVSVKLRFNPPVTQDTMSRRGSSSIVKEESFSSSGRPVRGAKLAAERKFVSYAEDSDEDGIGEDEEPMPTRRTGRSTAGKSAARYSDEEPRPSPVRERRSSRRHHPDPDDEEEEDEVVQPARNAFPTRSTRHNGIPAEPPKPERRDSADEYVEPSEPSATEDDEPSDDPVMNQYGTPSEDDFIEYDDRPPRRRTTRKPTRRSTRNSNRRQDSEDEYGAPKRQLRQRTSKVNYELPPLDISAELMQEAITNVAGPSRRRGVGFPSARFKGMPWAPGSLPQAMGDVDSSDSDLDMMVPKTAGGPGGPPGQGLRPPAGPSDVPNFGRVNPKSNLADADPLGVDMNVTFDNVGGLDNHINQLKEMVALPLLYPELFQKFGLTPPRGVLFHGPPGTGKTLLARALAASCSTGNTKIAFFMRKGADVLSKWVGEAERQLRMLFEEARASQPSIIFFDEIDGLAPVRSSKQDQIHASLVSTLLALMDGMDGRGQVIVIGATNRPDAVDSALRRPGRFDREFYFPLPNREARRKIIQINTKEWAPLSEPLLDRLSIMTKGYGGADLRALCTEAALNAIQRRYPQIYKSTDRLLLDHSSISVGAKDFMMSIQKITPSSARSTASAASQLPPHLIPLLSAPLERLKTAVDRILPRHKHLTALEDAEFVDDIGDDLDKHMMVQSLDKLRTYRPRLLIHGPPGMGHTYLGPAILHHLEGFHVQSLDVGTLMADSTRTPEATLVQLFVEAKRHQPSILFIPSLLAWSHALTDSARTTFQSLLDGVPSSDPVLLLAMADVPAHDIPRDIRSWFGASKESRAELTTPTTAERHEYLASLFDAFKRPPVDFPDALPRQKRVLEELPLAPPIPPRQPTEAETQRELDRDQHARTMMIISFTSLVQEFLKKYRKVVAGVRDDAFVVTQMLADQAAAAAVPTIEIVEPPAELPNGHTEPMPEAVAPPAPTEPPVITPGPSWQAHDVDIETLHRKLLRNKYHTPADFLDDVAKIEDNAAHIGDADRQSRVAEMAAHARIHVTQFDPKWTPEFERLKVRMRMRKEEREKEKAKEAQAQAQADPVADSGDVPETSTVAESSLKRPREDESDDRNGKRPRDDAMEVDPQSQPSAPEPVATVPEPRPVVHPPFVLPPELWTLFESTLRDDTADLSVDDLEQIRAGCFDRLWRRRGDWDRTEVVRECLDWVKEHMKEVRELREESD